MDAIAELQEKRNQIAETRKATQTRLVAEMHLTDDSTDAEWDKLSDLVDVETGHSAHEMAVLGAEIERLESIEIAEHIFNRKPVRQIAIDED